VSYRSCDKILETIIPLMVAGFEPTNPKDIHFIDSYSIGYIYFGFYSVGRNCSCYLLIKVGSEGP